MIEIRVLEIVAPLLERLKLHQPRKCWSDLGHTALIEPELGCMDLEINPVPDAAVYTCAVDRCEWRRKDRLKR